MAEGDINVVLDSFEFEANRCYNPRIIHVVDDIYAIVYRDVDGDGQLLTVSIDDTGDIGASVIDQYEFDTTRAYDPRIIHIYGTVFAIAYTGADYDGWIITITISAAGDIGGAPIDSMEYDAVKSLPQSIIHVAGIIYAIAYTGNLTKGYVCTFTISDAGDIGAAVIEKAAWLPTPMNEPEIIHVYATVYAIVYKGTSDHGTINTLSILSDGDIGGAAIDTFEFDTGFCEDPRIIQVSNTIFAIVYKGPDSDGFLKTVSIANNGNIGASVIDTFEFDPSMGLIPYIIHVSGDVYSIAYTGPDSDGFVKTITIASDGTITEPAIDSFEFETVEADQCIIIHVTGDIYAIVFDRGNDEGVLKTIGVETILPGAMRYFPLMGIG